MDAVEYVFKHIPNRAVTKFINSIFEYNGRDMSFKMRSQFLDDEGKPCRISEFAMESLVKQAVEG